MEIDIEILYNKQKETYSIIDLTSLKSDSIKGSCVNTIVSLLGDDILKSFPTREALNDYIKSKKKVQKLKEKYGKDYPHEEL